MLGGLITHAQTSRSDFVPSRARLQSNAEEARLKAFISCCPCEAKRSGWFRNSAVPLEIERVALVWGQAAQMAGKLAPRNPKKPGSFALVAIGHFVNATDVLADDHV
jgi:hypothetical protein